MSFVSFTLTSLWDAMDPADFDTAEEVIEHCELEGYAVPDDLDEHYDTL